MARASGLMCSRTCPSGQIAPGMVGLALALALAWPEDAAASNPWLTPLGGEAAMSGGAVASTGRDTGMAYYNPAGLGANRRVQFNMSTTTAVLRYRTIPDAFRVELPGGRTNSGTLASIEPLVLATSTVYTRYMGRGVTVGGAHFANNYDRYDYSGALNDATTMTGLNYRANVQVDGWSTRHFFGPTVGWEVTPRLRLGMSLFVTYEWRRDEGQIWLQSGPTPELIDQNFIAGNIDLKRSTYGTEAVFGLQWEFVKNLHLGLAIRTPRLAVYEKARKNSLVTGAVLRDDDSRAALFQFDDVPAAARRGRIAPMQVVLGLAYAFSRGRGWISVEGDYSPKLYLPKNNVNLRHTFNGRIGARIRAGENLYVGLGAFTDRTNEQAITDFPQFNLDYYGGSMGIELRRPFKLGKNERARDIVFSTAVAVRYAWGVGASGAVRFDLTHAHSSKLSYKTGEVSPVHFHVWSGHLGAGMYF